jgi:hypothetical protein
MNNKYLNKIITITIYFLTLMLICLILYNLFLLISKIYYSSEPPKNSIKLSSIHAEWKGYNYSCFQSIY